MRLFAAPHLVLAAYCAGLCLALAVRPPAVWLAVALVLGVTAALAVRRDAHTVRIVAALVALAGLFVCTGAAVGSAQLQKLSRSSLAARTGERLPLRAQLTDLPAVGAGEVTLAVRVVEAGGAPLREPAHLRLRLADGQTFALDPTGPLVEGAIVSLPSVSVEPLPEAAPGEFDYGRFLRRRGEHVALEADFGDLSVVGRRGGLQGGIDRLRQACREHLTAGVSSPVRDVLQGMVLGDDEGVPASVVEDFRRSGLLHIMAVSGENVVLLCGMWSFAFALLGIGRFARTALLLPVVVTYVLLTGASPSIVRAGVAGVMGLLAIMVSRPGDGWLFWLAPAAWILTVNPNSIYDVSFQLSFGAVVGLLVLARPITRALSFLPGPLPAQAGVTTAASISTAPVSMLAFGSVSLVGVPANVAGGFVLGPIMFLGMLSLLLGFVSEWLSAALNVVAGLFIGFLLAVSHFFAVLPGSVFEYRGLSVGLLLVVGLGLEALVVVLLAWRSGAGLRAWSADRRRRGALAAATGLLVAGCLLLAPAPVRPPDRPTLTILDVGEGAASLLQTPDGPTVLVDAGPNPLAAQLGRHAVRRIDLLVVSHGHADHVAGLDDVVGRIPVAVALLPQPPAPSAALDDLAARLAAAGAEVRRCVAPQRLAGAGWTLDVLPSRAPAGEGGNQGENDCALVALVDLGGHDVLLPGDCEGDVLGALGLPPCEVVELPHHGSAGGLDAALLADLGPRLGVVSVGPNTYGHPTEEMLGLFAAAALPLLRTDQRGDVALWLGAGGLEVATARGA